MPRLFCLAVLLAVVGPRFSEVVRAAPPLRVAIDEQTERVWRRDSITPAEPADDATFLRRVYLDLWGLIPDYDTARSFLDDTDAAKRERLIDRLLDDPRHAQHQADVWDLVFFGRNPPGYDAGKREGFQTWLRESFQKNEPHDVRVRTMLRAEGNSAEQGAPMYLIQYDRRPEDAVIAVSQNLLGVQLQCARCHDHPYEKWTQRDFYGMAAFFARLTTVRDGKAGSLDKIYLGEMNTGEMKFAGPAKEATAGKEGEPIQAKFLLGAAVDEPDLSAEFKNEKRPSDGRPPAPPKFSRKDRLADWVVSQENPYFARAAVNRVWAQFLGRGLVHPVDNMSESNPSTHPELLDLLAAQFREHSYDMKWLVREICNSRTYQLGSTGDVAEAFPASFQRARTRPLSAEELLESWRIATGYDEAIRRAGKRPEQRFHGVTWDYVRRFFGEPSNGAGDFQGGLQEHLYLNNGELPRLMTTEAGGLVAILSDEQTSWDERVERLFLSVLSRRPTEAERRTFVEHLSEKEKSQERLREAIWTLLSCSEFRFNH